MSRGSCPQMLGSVVSGILIGLVVGSLAASSASAHDAASTPLNGIVGQDDYLQPGSGDEPWNGIRIFLSSPRHEASGSKGECKNPGFEENVNGRRWNWLAANAAGHYTIHERGYLVRVSKNRRDGDFQQNFQASRNWGSDIHIVTHTNGDNGCPSSADYSLFLWEHDGDNRDDRSLANEIRKGIAPSIPGPAVMDRRSRLLELATNARWGDAYVELQFHDNPARQEWIYRHSDSFAYLYGYSLDRYLGYP